MFFFLKDDGVCGVFIFDFYELESCIYLYLCLLKDLMNKRFIEIMYWCRESYGLVVVVNKEFFFFF